MVVLLSCEEYQPYQDFTAQRAERAAWFAALHRLAEHATASGALSDAEADVLIETAFSLDPTPSRHTFS